MKKETKLGLMLIVLGQLLYLVRSCFFLDWSTDFGDFISGALLGISIAIQLIGIILLASITKLEEG